MYNYKKDHFNPLHILYILWHVYPLLDNARNIHAANGLGTVFSSSADGLSLCNSRAVTSNNSTWPSHDMFLTRGGDVAQQYW
jgi:hypothetical protein